MPDYFLNSIISDAFQNENRLVIWLFLTFGYINMIRNLVFYLNFYIIYKKYAFLLILLKIELRLIKLIEIKEDLLKK